MLRVSSFMFHMLPVKSGTDRRLEPDNVPGDRCFTRRRADDHRDPCRIFVGEWFIAEHIEHEIFDIYIPTRDVHRSTTTFGTGDDLIHRVICILDKVPTGIRKYHISASSRRARGARTRYRAIETIPRPHLAGHLLQREWNVGAYHNECGRLPLGSHRRRKPPHRDSDEHSKDRDGDSKLNKRESSTVMERGMWNVECPGLVAILLSSYKFHVLCFRFRVS